jgi:hypothetical protein
LKTSTTPTFASIARWNFNGEDINMPKYNEPEHAVGLTLRAVIEGEIMTNSWLNRSEAAKVADAIEARIHAGPSDRLSLSEGTTFTKTWVPEGPDSLPVTEVIPVERWKQFGGHIDTKTWVPPTPHFHTDSSGTFKCPLSSECNLRDDQDPIVARTANAIHAAHEGRVKANTERAYERGLDKLMRDLQEQDLNELTRRVSREIHLEEDIFNHEKWLCSLGSKRIFIQ